VPPNCMSMSIHAANPFSLYENIAWKRSCTPAVEYAEIEELLRCAQYPLLSEDSMGTSSVVSDPVPIAMGNLVKKIFMSHKKSLMLFHKKPKRLIGIKAN
jgi:hypothetical protein